MTDQECHSGSGRVGTTPKPLSELDFAVRDGDGVTVRADDTNEGTIKIGSIATLKFGRGFPLAAGKSMRVVNLGRLAELYVVSTQADQAYTWLLTPSEFQ